MWVHATGRRSGRTISSTYCASPRLSRLRAPFFTLSATTKSSHAGSAWPRRESRRSSASDRKRGCEFAPTHQSPDDHGTQIDPAPSHPTWPLTLARTSDRIKDYPSDARATLQVGRTLIDVAENAAHDKPQFQR